MNKNPKETYKHFKTWIEDQCRYAEIMQEVKDTTVQAELLEKNAQAWQAVDEMLNDHTLHYQPQGKPRTKKHQKQRKRPNMVEVMLALYEFESLLGTLEVLQEDMNPKYQEVYCEARVELDELVASLLAECQDCLTDEESDRIDAIQIAEQKGD